MCNITKIMYEAKEKNKKYNIILSYDDREVAFKVKEKNFLGKEYEASYSLAALIEKNNIFKVCDKVEDSYNYILNIINDGKYFLSQEGNQIVLTFFIKNLIEEKDEEMKLYLNLKNIYSIIENQNKKMQDIINENFSLKKEILELKDEVEYLKNNINKIIDEKIMLYFSNDLNKSTILENPKEKIFFKNLIKCRSLKLLYRLSKDGSDPKDFHRLCDNQGATLTLFKSQNNKKFGGYLSKSWESAGNWKKDNNAFLFSIDLEKIYKLKSKELESYFCYNQLGPCFKKLGFQNFGNLLHEGKCFEYDLKDIYEIGNNYKKYEITGNENILCKDIEVYKICII